MLGTRIKKKKNAKNQVIFGKWKQVKIILCENLWGGFLFFFFYPFAESSTISFFQENFLKLKRKCDFICQMSYCKSEYNIIGCVFHLWNCERKIKLNKKKVCETKWFFFNPYAELRAKRFFFGRIYLNNWKKKQNKQQKNRRFSMCETAKKKKKRCILFSPCVELSEYFSRIKNR